MLKNLQKPKQNVLKRKNPRKTLTEEKLLELASRKNVDSVRVLVFFNSSFVRINHRETVLEWLKEYTNSYNLNLPTVKAIREGIDLLHNHSGPSERSFDFSHYGDLVESDRYEGYLTELTGTQHNLKRI